MENIHEEEYQGLNIKIVNDEDTDSPNSWSDNSVFLVGYHREFTVEAPTFTLPKDQWTLADHKSICNSCGQRNFTSIKETGNKCGKCGEESRIDKTYYKNTQSNPMFSKDELLAFMEKDKENFNVETFKQFHVFGLEAYIHSGVSLSLSNEGNFPDRQWDVSQLGAVLISKKEFKTRAKAKKCAQGLIEAWNDYLSGNIYGYQIEDNEGYEIDSCYGFYGDYEKNALQEARNTIDHMTNKGTTDHKGQKLMAFVK